MHYMFAVWQASPFLIGRPVIEDWHEQVNCHTEIHPLPLGLPYTHCHVTVQRKLMAIHTELNVSSISMFSISFIYLVHDETRQFKSCVSPMMLLMSRQLLLTSSQRLLHGPWWALGPTSGSQRGIRDKHK